MRWSVLTDSVFKGGLHRDPSLLIAFPGPEHAVARPSKLNKKIKKNQFQHIPIQFRAHRAASRSRAPSLPPARPLLAGHANPAPRRRCLPRPPSRRAALGASAGRALRPADRGPGRVATGSGRRAAAPPSRAAALASTRWLQGLDAPPPRNRATQPLRLTGSSSRAGRRAAAPPSRRG
ncbi:unnamed protein product [Urochloa humidicola]